MKQQEVEVEQAAAVLVARRGRVGGGAPGRGRAGGGGATAGGGRGPRELLVTQQEVEVEAAMVVLAATDAKEEARLAEVWQERRRGGGRGSRGAPRYAAGGQVCRRQATVTAGRGCRRVDAVSVVAAAAPPGDSRPRPSSCDEEVGGRCFGSTPPSRLLHTMADVCSAAASDETLAPFRGRRPRPGRRASCEERA